MAIKVKAVERKLKFTKNENDPGVYRYVLGAELMPRRPGEFKFQSSRFKVQSDPRVDDKVL